MRLPKHSIDQEMLHPCLGSVRDALMDVKVAVKFGYHRSEVVKYYTLDRSEA